MITRIVTSQQLCKGLTAELPLSCFVYGSEYLKGSEAAGNSIDASFTRLQLINQSS
jgi:hypothetical protein